MSQTKYRGVPIVMDGRTFVVPSLSLRQYRDFSEALSTPVEVETKEQLLEAWDKYVPIIGTALRRNYPNLSDESLNDWLDLDSFPEALRAVQNAAGMTKVSADDQGNG